MTSYSKIARNPDFLTFMKCFEKIRGNFRIPEPDEIILDRVIAKNIDAAVPYCTFVDNGSM